MSGRFSIRRVASPQLAPEQPAVVPEMAAAFAAHKLERAINLFN